MTLNKAIEIIRSYPNTKIIEIRLINIAQEDGTLLLGSVAYDILNHKYIYYITNDTSEKEIRETMKFKQ